MFSQSGTLDQAASLTLNPAPSWGVSLGLGIQCLSFMGNAHAPTFFETLE